MAKGDLNEKQACFAREYVKDLNATQAAIRAGYAKGSAEVTGCKLLRNTKVKAYVQELMDKRASKDEYTADDILKEINSIAFMKEKKMDKRGLTYRDKMKALELSGKHKKLFTDKVEHSGNIKVVMEDYSEDDD